MKMRWVSNRHCYPLGSIPSEKSARKERAIWTIQADLNSFFSPSSDISSTPVVRSSLHRVIPIGPLLEIPETMPALHAAEEHFDDKHHKQRKYTG